MGLPINDSVYSCVFFFLTGLHFFHLLLGLLLLSLLFWSCSFSFLFLFIISLFSLELLLEKKNPEWYFLCQYAMLKAVPNKNAGFIILFTSIFSFFFFGEIRNLTTLCVLPLVNNGFSLSSFFLSLLSYLWIGAQFPQEKFLSYGRILTLHYYFLLMCILFSLLSSIFL